MKGKGVNLQLGNMLKLRCWVLGSGFWVLVVWRPFNETKKQNLQLRLLREPEILPEPSTQHQHQAKNFDHEGISFYKI